MIVLTALSDMRPPHRAARLVDRIGLMTGTRPPAVHDGPGSPCHRARRDGLHLEGQAQVEPRMTTLEQPVVEPGVPDRPHVVRLVGRYPRALGKPARHG